VVGSGWWVVGGGWWAMMGGGGQRTCQLVGGERERAERGEGEAPDHLEDGRGGVLHDHQLACEDGGRGGEGMRTGGEASCMTTSSPVGRGRSLGYDGMEGGEGGEVDR
jgi:hypothetical protein